MNITSGARLLKKYLQETGLSYRAFGAKTGIDAGEICRYLSGERSPSLWAAFSIEDATGGAVRARSWLFKLTTRVAA